MDTSNNRLPDEADLTFLTRDEELLVERLVDGELPDQERGALIHLLDERVDGWRFLALTFLEEQALRQALKNIKPEDYSYPMSRARSFPKEKTLLKRPIYASIGMAIGILLVCGIVFWNIGEVDRETLPSEGNGSVMLVDQSPKIFPDDEVYLAHGDNIAATPPIVQASEHNIILNSPSQGLSNIVTTLENCSYNEMPSLEPPPAPVEVISQLNDNSELVDLDTRRDIYKFPLQGGKTLILPIDTYHIRTGNVW